MSETTDEDIDTCRRANEAALEKGLSFCDTSEARLSVLGRLFGYDDIDTDEIQAVDPDDETEVQRKRVLARAEEIIAEGGEGQPLDALNRAWGDVATPEPREGDGGGSGGDGSDADEDGDVEGPEDEGEEADGGD